MPYLTHEFHILIIEDNVGDYTLVADFLHEHIKSPQIVHVKNFQDAKRALASKCGTFDAVLLDLSLPDKTGSPLIDEIVSLCPAVPVIVLTGYSDFLFGVRSLSLGISDYLLKDELTSTHLYKSIVYGIERKKNITALA